jgi:phosphoenolpyruvate---glycerone phosphotransferase subunit DhaL
VSVMVNSLGATPPEELYILYRTVKARIEGAGAAIVMPLVGPLRHLDGDGGRVLHALQARRRPRGAPEGALRLRVLEGRMTLDRAALQGAIARLAAAMERDFDMLNAADGALGDGDLGVTMTRGMRLVSEKAGELPEDLGQALLACAQAFTKASGSSYGTLMATGLMAMAKALKGETAVPAARVSELVALARDQMQARGKAELGGKTVLDSLDAVAQATAGKDDPAGSRRCGGGGGGRGAGDFRDRKATVGRARIFAEKSVGMDDPGMLAMNRIVKALADREG